MTKKSDQRAGGFETDDMVGGLSGLLADEETLDRHAMFRLGTWGAASVGAVVVAVLANQMAFRSRRDEVAALDLARQSQQIQSVAHESQNETRRLASAIDTLNSDRDRLYTRLTSLEQGLDSVTGTIAKQSAIGPQAAMLAAAPAIPPQPAVQATPPEPAPVTATAAVTPAPEKPRAEGKKPPQPAAAPVAVALPSPTSASPASASPASASPVSSAPPPIIPAPLMASKSMMAPPDPGAGKLIEPEPPKITAAMPSTPSAQPTSSVTSAPMIPATPQPEPTPQAIASTTAADKAEAEPALSSRVQVAVNHTEFGVDVGSANSVGGLRAMWRGLLKSRSNAALAALQPIIVVKERDNGLGLQLRLVAGPLSDAAAAAKICAVMAANQRPCETTVFDGQRLALKNTDEPTTTETIAAKPDAAEESPDKSGPDNPASAKPSATKPISHRRNAAKRAAVEEAAKKPETPPSPPLSSGLSSFFSRTRTQ